MKIEKIEVGHLKSNCYLVMEGDDCLIIDPGDDADYIQRRIADYNVLPQAIIATHGHFDHILAATELKIVYSIPFLMNDKDSFLLDRMQSSAKHFTGQNVAPPPQIDLKLDDGELKIGEWTLEVISTSGHTPGSVSLYFPEEESVFVGDLVFADGYVGRTDFKYSDTSILYESIKKVKKLPSGISVYSGHGDMWIL